jgi:hypothetical protein
VVYGASHRAGQLGETYGEGDPKEWSTVLVTALGSWGETVPRGHNAFVKNIQVYEEPLFTGEPSTL